MGATMVARLTSLLARVKLAIALCTLAWFAAIASEAAS